MLSQRWKVTYLCPNLRWMQDELLEPDIIRDVEARGAS